MMLVTGNSLKPRPREGRHIAIDNDRRCEIRAGLRASDGKVTASNSPSVLSETNPRHGYRCRAA
jgi:hypothetical protein